ncbi:MAG: metallophosphoesterase family protein [Treponema sp.]|nr:metallophosphoesterase family protein [Treponema sp.]
MKSNIKKIIGFICLLGTSAALASAAPEPVDLVYTNPGQDCAHSVRLSWHTAEENSVVYWSKAEDAEFKHAAKLKSKGVKTPVEFHDGEQYYRHEAVLEGLKKDTSYHYKIVLDSGYESKEYSFTTADNDGEFGFLWTGDVHTHPDISIRRELSEKLALAAEKNLDDDMDLVVSTGDEVCYGAYYDNWQEWQNGYINRKVWAGIPGNHTYYDVFPKKGQEIVDNRWWCATQNPPDNGPEVMRSNFWFKYDSILFIGIDSIDTSHLNEQKKWFEQVLQENKDTYQYLIVYQHYPYISGFNGGFGGTNVSYYLWMNLFDKYGVDLALSGDHHVYLQSNALVQKKTAEDGISGTTYFVCPQIGDRSREMQGTINPSIIKSRITSSDLAYESGLSYFKVTKEGITHTLLDGDGEIVESHFIPAKRPYVEPKESSVLILIFAITALLIVVTGTLIIVRRKNKK